MYISTINRKGTKHKNNLTAATNKWVNNLTLTNTHEFQAAKAKSAFVSYHICNNTTKVLARMNEENLSIKQAAEAVWEQEHFPGCSADYVVNWIKFIQSQLHEDEVLDKVAITTYIAKHRKGEVSQFAREHNLSIGAAGLQYTDKLIATLPMHANNLERKEKNQHDINTAMQQQDKEPNTSTSYLGNAWERIEAVVDSGASNHVVPAQVGKKYPIQETKASLNDDYFSGADGSKMRNLDCKDICALTRNHNKIKARVQVAANVKRTLLSVNKLVEGGNLVVFDNHHSYIYNPHSGQSLPIHKSNGVYRMNLWIPKDTRDPKSVTTGRISSIDQVQSTTPSQETANVQDDDTASGFLRLLPQA